MIIGFTGHREVHNISRCVIQLEYELKRLAADVCIIGCARGFDTVAGWYCVINNIAFDMYLPFEESYYDKELRKYCRNFIVLFGSGYTDKKFLDRDEKIVDDSDMMISWHDGRNKGGTFYTINYAKGKNKDVINLYK